MITVVVVHDDALFRLGLQKIFSGEEIQIVGEASTGKTGFELIRRKQPRVVFLNIYLPDMTGAFACQYIHRHFPSMCSIIWFSHVHLPTLNRLMSTSAKGFLTQGACYCSIEAIKTVVAGKTYLQPDIALDLLNYRLMNSVYVIENLNNKEYEILIMLARGKTYETIAETLHISLRTVYNLRSSGCKKLGVKTREELVIILFGGIL